MKIKVIESIGTIGIKTELSIFELQRLKELQQNLEKHNHVLDSQSPILKGFELEKLLESANLAASFLAKICGDTPSIADVDKELFLNIDE